MKKLLTFLIVSVFAFGCSDEANVPENKSNLNDYLMGLVALQQDFDYSKDPILWIADVSELYSKRVSTKTTNIECLSQEEAISLIESLDINEGDLNFEEYFGNIRQSIVNSDYPEYFQYIYNISVFIIKENNIVPQDLDDSLYIGDFSFSDSLIYQLVDDTTVPEEIKIILMSRITILNSLALAYTNEMKPNIKALVYETCERDRDTHLANLRAQKIYASILGVVIAPVGAVVSILDACTDCLSDYYAKREAQIMEWYANCVKARGY